MTTAAVESDRAVILLGDPRMAATRGVEKGKGTFQNWQRGAWGKRTRKEGNETAGIEAGTMGRLHAVVTLDNGDTVHVEPCQVEFVDKHSPHRYPNC